IRWVDHKGRWVPVIDGCQPATLQPECIDRRTVSKWLINGLESPPFELRRLFGCHEGPTCELSGTFQRCDRRKVPHAPYIWLTALSPRHPPRADIGDGRTHGSRRRTRHALPSPL